MTGFGDEPAGDIGQRDLAQPKVDPQKAIAAGAIVACMRVGGRASLDHIARELQQPRRRILKALDLAKREQLVWSRDRNVWVATEKAWESFAGGRAKAQAA